jgi:hypothetical protein
MPDHQNHIDPRALGGSIPVSTPGANSVSVGVHALFTMEALFALIQRAIHSKVAVLDVTYDPDYGYPEQLYIDWNAPIADEEISSAQQRANTGLQKHHAQ